MKRGRIWEEKWEEEGKIDREDQDITVLKEGRRTRMQYRVSKWQTKRNRRETESDERLEGKER